MIGEILTKFGETLSSITGMGPAESTILLGIGLSLIPPLYRGVLDNRLESVIENLSYTRAILVGSTVVSYYFIFQTGVAEELILSVGGIILGLTLNDWINTLTDL